MRLFLDANVVLDVLLSRQPFVNDSERVLSDFGCICPEILQP